MESAQYEPDINTSSYLLERLSMGRSIKHYSNFHQILLVGEGDFSFSLALANAFGSAENMVTTSLDSKEKVLRLYKSAHETLSNLEKLGATVLHDVDAMAMEKHHIIRKMRFHRIVFNFPHAGFHGREDQKSVIKKHRDLLKMFFTNARTLLSEIGEIHVTHKENGPYKLWELVKQAEECGLLLKDSVEFKKTDYHGYTNRKGAGRNAGRTFHLGECRTYKFVLGPELLFTKKLLAIQVVLSNLSSEDSAENFETVIVKTESSRKPKMAGKMRKEDSETLIDRLEMLLNEEINTSDEFARQMTETLHQMVQAWRVKAKIAEQLDEALDAIKRNEASLTDAILEIESERRARMAAETAKVCLKKSLNNLKLNLNKELKKNAELKLQRDEANVKSEIVEQLDEALDAIKELTLELQSAIRAREAAEIENIHLVTSLNHLKAILGKEVKRNNELEKQRDAVFLQIKAAETEKVDSEMSLNHLKVSLSKELRRNNELEKQRDAAFLQIKAAETEKIDSEMSLNHLKVSLSKELRRNNELEKQRDAAFLQEEKSCREKTSIAKQLDEALAKDAARKREDDTANKGCCGFCFVFFILYIFLSFFKFILAL